jgi:4-hydroxy-tetrahydrodipicolinate reductase
MLKIALTGHAGAMGKNLIEMVQADPELELVAGIDRSQVESHGFKQYSSFEELSLDKDMKIDAIIDFSHHSMVSSMLDYASDTKTPVVICTTGISDEDSAKIAEVSKSVPLFKSGNMSVGINLMIELSRRAAEILGDSFDIEIIEKHHNRKVDAPSGTAYMIAEGINDALHNSKEYVYGRSGNSCKRQPEEIGIHAVRGGTIVGEHTVIYAGNDEIVELKHTASSRKVFAKGAIDAAKYLASREPGLYDMKKMLGEMFA